MDGSFNIAIGRNALCENSLGKSNTSVGYQALNFITFGEMNTALGRSSNVTLNNLTNTTAIEANASVNTYKSKIKINIYEVAKLTERLINKRPLAV